MDGLSDVLTVIGNYGFPIMACLGIFYLYNTTIVNLVGTLQKMEKTLDRICSILMIDEGGE